MSLNSQTSHILSNIFKKNPNSKFRELHSYCKIYPDKIKIIKYHRPIILNNFADNQTPISNEEPQEERDYLQKSINRTKTKISDYVLCNSFTHFATFTFDPQNPKVGTVHRYNFKKMADLLKNWLKTEQQNHERNHGRKFKYLIVPERHKDGAWHFHALLEGYENPTHAFNSKLNKYATYSEKIAKTPKKSRKFIIRYNLGRSEIEPIRDKTKMSSYIKKYITKELITEPDAKRFWSSRNLKSPEILENIVLEHTQIPEKYKVIEHDYHTIYEIPTVDSFADLLSIASKIELSERRQRLLDSLK